MYRDCIWNFSLLSDQLNASIREWPTGSPFEASIKASYGLSYAVVETPLRSSKVLLVCTGRGFNGGMLESKLWGKRIICNVCGSGQLRRLMRYVHRRAALSELGIRFTSPSNPSASIESTLWGPVTTISMRTYWQYASYSRRHGRHFHHEHRKSAGFGPHRHGRSLAASTPTFLGHIWRIHWLDSSLCHYGTAIFMLHRGEDSSIAKLISPDLALSVAKCGWNLYHQYMNCSSKHGRKQAA